jgi:hypothetical protein
LVQIRKTTPKNCEQQYNEELKVAEQEIKNGKFYSHSEIKGKIEQWKKNNLGLIVSL